MIHPTHAWHDGASCIYYRLCDQCRCSNIQASNRSCPARGGYGGKRCCHIPSSTRSQTILQAKRIVLKLAVILVEEPTNGHNIFTKWVNHLNKQYYKNYDDTMLENTFTGHATWYFLSIKKTAVYGSVSERSAAVSWHYILGIGLCHKPVHRLRCPQTNSDPIEKHFSRNRACGRIM